MRLLVAVSVAATVAVPVPKPLLAQSCAEADTQGAEFCPLTQHPRTAVTDAFGVEFLSLDMRDAQLGFLRLRITNSADDSLFLGVDVLTSVGGWFRRANVQRQRGFELAAGASTVAELEIVISGYSPDASLRLRFGPAERVVPNGFRLSEVLVDRRYDLSGSLWGRRTMERFAEESGRYLTVFVRRGFGLEDQLSRLVHERENALTAAAALLQVPPRSGVRVVIYPDAQLKWVDTGHWGAGWAFDSTIVEVAGGDAAMDPFHELTHILARSIGSPPAMFNEGLATYAAEHLGGDALAFLGYAGRPSLDVICGLEQTNELIPLRELFSFTSIGNDDTRPRVSYPQSASVVGYLIAEFGFDRFRRAYRTLRSDDSPDVLASNLRAFTEIYGEDLAVLEAGWLEELRSRCG